MSYSTMDRFGGMATKYHGRSEPSAGTCRTWWPDFGPGSHDFSQQTRSHPCESIFDRIVKPKTWCGAQSASQPPEPLAPQFMHPLPAREAILHKSQPTVEAKLAAHEVTERQASLRRLETRQRKIDAWLEVPPIRAEPSSPPGPRRSRSEATLSSSLCSKASRDVYERHGFLVGRSSGGVADGYSGLAPRRHNPLSYHSMMFSGSLLGEARRSGRPQGPRKPSRQWRTCPESSFVLDPKTCLPVPRGSSVTSWPAIEGAGRREHVASGTFGRSEPSSPLGAAVGLSEPRGRAAG